MIKYIDKSIFLIYNVIKKFDVSFFIGGFMILKDLRKERGMTQAEVALKVGVKQNTISLWENGENFPSMRYLFKLSELFNCTIDELLKGEK